MNYLLIGLLLGIGWTIGDTLVNAIVMVIRLAVRGTNFEAVATDLFFGKYADKKNSDNEPTNRIGF